MKVAVVSSFVLPSPPPHYGGLEQIAYQCADGLAGLGHDVTLIAAEGSQGGRAKLMQVSPPGQWDEKQAYQHYWAKLPEFDVCIDHSWAKWGVILKQEGRMPNPLLLVCHAPVNSMFGSPPPVERACVVCISEDQKAHYEALFGRKARLCYNGADVEFYKSTGVPRTDRFLFLARFSSIKGADIAIEACLRAGVGLDLVGDDTITGEPDFYHRCVALADRTSEGWDRNKGRQIRIIGPASRGECVTWFSRAKALIHPNQRFREPFGLAPVEGMLCSLPCIAWRYGSMSETVSDLSGTLVDSFDGLVHAIQTYAEADLRPLGKSAREWAMRFSVENMVRGYDGLIREAKETGGW